MPHCKIARGIAVLAIVFIAGDVLAQSKQQPQTPQVPAQQESYSAVKGQQKPSEQKRAAKKPIASVPIPEASNKGKKTQNDAEKSANEASEYWVIFDRRVKITDSLLALFTLALVVISAKQASRLRETVDSFVAGERPHIFLADAQPAFFRTGSAAMYAATTPSSTAPEPSIEWIYQNYGRTPAIVISTRAEIFLGTELPPERVFTYSILRKGENIIGTDSERRDNLSGPATSFFERHITIEEENALREGKSTFFFFFGFIKYKDIFNGTHVYNFGFKIIQDPKRVMMVAGGKEYNYSESQKAKKKLHWNPLSCS